MTLSVLLQACDGNLCYEAPEAGERFASDARADLAIVWESTRYDDRQMCLRTDTFIIQGANLPPSELGNLLEHQIERPEQLRGASIRQEGSDIRLTFSLFDRPPDTSYSFTVHLDDGAVTATIPLQN